MPRPLHSSVETLLRLTPAMLGSTAFSIASRSAAHECLDHGAPLAALLDREVTLKLLKPEVGLNEEGRTFPNRRRAGGGASWVAAGVSAAELRSRFSRCCYGANISCNPPSTSVRVSVERLPRRLTRRSWSTVRSWSSTTYPVRF